MRRILVPAGYGATHPAAENSDSQGRALNRRVDVKVLVNGGAWRSRCRPNATSPSIVLGGNPGVNVLHINLSHE